MTLSSPVHLDRASFLPAYCSSYKLHFLIIRRPCFTQEETGQGQIQQQSEKAKQLNRIHLLTIHREGENDTEVEILLLHVEISCHVTLVARTCLLLSISIMFTHRNFSYNTCSRHKLHLKLNQNNNGGQYLGLHLLR